MEKKKPTVLPGLVNVDTKPKVLAGIKKAADNFKGSALPIMKYFSDVKPSRNEKIIKPDMTPGGKVINQDLPTIREALKPGFSSNFTTNYTPPPAGTTPAISGVPTISSQTEVGQTITATPASVTGSPTPTTSWQWERSSDGATGWANISAATASTYTLVAADDTKYARAVQTETNAVGSDTANSASSGQVSGYDADAAAYFTAASITDTTEKDAVDQLVKDLKGTGNTTNDTDVWSDMDTIYPVSPTSLAAAAFNLKDPTAYEITWYNSPTHATTGITGNSTSMYGDTGWNLATNGDVNNFGLTYSGAYVNGDHAMGVVDSTSSPAAYFMIRNVSNKKHFYAGEGGTSANSSTTARNIFTGVRDAADNRQPYLNGVAGTPNTTTDTAALPSLNMFLLCRNVNGAAASFFAGEIDFWAIHKGLTANQAQDLYDAITTYNTALSR